MKKANRQLKETNLHFFTGQGGGLVMLALNMERRINSAIIVELIQKILSIEFSFIDGFFVCTPSWGEYIAATDNYHSVISGRVKPGMPKELEDIVSIIANSWCDFVDEKGHS
ncbi:hypothetical protein [Leptospira interrogans]|uniref:Uncharacterized protein n=1 Tax=Leptospira interrogans serovar Canicola TaxID=211880 RepID=A0AAP9WEP0_LEPIR|nr:hypothetical protein [Leptospira interrogans]QOI43607.1 hypothetical protein Lepto782_16025 [Leptospira interrogans serovar Canicola]